MASRRRTSGVAVDLGTATSQVANETGIVVEEATAVAYDHAGAVIATGDDALKMVGRTPDPVRVSQPVRAAAITDLAAAEDLLRWALRRAVARRRLRPPRVAASVPVSANQIERRARIRTLQRAGAGGNIVLVEAPLAAAIGAGLPIGAPFGTMVVDVGRGITEAAVISLGAMVTADADAVGGETAEQAIVRHLREIRGLAVGAAAARRVIADLADGRSAITVEGGDLTTGLPRAVDLSAKIVHDALEETLLAIGAVARRALDNAPVALAADVMVGGITVTGGGAHLPGAVERIAEVTGVPVHAADRPEQAVISGVRACLDGIDPLGPYLRSPCKGAQLTTGSERTR